MYIFLEKLNVRKFKVSYQLLIQRWVTCGPHREIMHIDQTQVKEEDIGRSQNSIYPGKFFHFTRWEKKITSSGNTDVLLMYQMTVIVLIPQSNVLFLKNCAREGASVKMEIYFFAI